MSYIAVVIVVDGSGYNYKVDECVSGIHARIGDIDKRMLDGREREDP